MRDENVQFQKPDQNRKYRKVGRKKNTQNSEFLYDNSLCTRSSEFGEKNNGKTQVHR